MTDDHDVPSNTEAMSPWREAPPTSMQNDGVTHDSSTDPWTALMGARDHLDPWNTSKPPLEPVSATDPAAQNDLAVHETVLTEVGIGSGSDQERPSQTRAPELEKKCESPPTATHNASPAHETALKVFPEVSAALRCRRTSLGGDHVPPYRNHDNPLSAAVTHTPLAGQASDWGGEGEVPEALRHAPVAVRPGARVCPAAVRAERLAEAGRRARHRREDLASGDHLWHAPPSPGGLAHTAFK